MANIDDIISKYLISEAPFGSARARALKAQKEKEKKAKEKAKEQKEKERIKKLAKGEWKMPTAKAFVKYLNTLIPEYKLSYIQSIDPSGYVSPRTWESRFYKMAADAYERDGIKTYFQKTSKAKIEESLKKFLDSVIKELGGQAKFDSLVKRSHIDRLEKDIKDDIDRLPHNDKNRAKAICAYSCLSNSKISFTVRDLIEFDYTSDIVIKKEDYDEFISVSVRASVRSIKYVFDVNCVDTKVKNLTYTHHLGTNRV